MWERELGFRNQRDLNAFVVVEVVGGRVEREGREVSIFYKEQQNK